MITTQKSGKIQKDVRRIGNMNKEKTKIAKIIASVIEGFKYLVGRSKESKTDRCLSDFKAKKKQLAKIASDGVKLVAKLESQRDGLFTQTRVKAGAVHRSYEAEILKLNNARFRETGKLWEAYREDSKNLKDTIKRERADVSKAKGALEVFDTIC